MSALPQPAGKTTLSLRSPGQRGYEKEKRSQGKLSLGDVSPPPPPPRPPSRHHGSTLHGFVVRFVLSCIIVSRSSLLCCSSAGGGGHLRAVRMCVCVCMLVVAGGPFLWEPSGPRPEPLNVRSSRPQPTPELQACT